MIRKKVKVGKFGGKFSKTSKVGTGRAEPIVETQSTLVEIPVRRNSIDIVMHESFSKGVSSLRDIKREPPTTTSGSPFGTNPRGP